MISGSVNLTSLWYWSMSLFDFIADGLRENEFTNTRGTERQRGLVEAPSRHDSAHQNIRVQKKTDFPRFVTSRAGYEFDDVTCWIEPGCYSGSRRRAFFLQAEFPEACQKPQQEKAEPNQ